MAEKKIEDYLHLYLGCEAKSSKGTMVYKLSSVDIKGRCMFYDGFGNDMWLGKDFELILRPLSDMMEDEKNEMEELTNGTKGHIKHTGWSYIQVTPIEFHWLLSKHFDLFGLHSNGLCLYKNNKNEYY